MSVPTLFIQMRLCAAVAITGGHRADDPGYDCSAEVRLPEISARMPSVVLPARLLNRSK